jgi:hypothetical protein
MSRRSALDDAVVEVFQGVYMIYPEDSDTKENTEKPEQHRLVLDGTASLDYADEEQVPRVKGLIELLNQYFGDRPK